MIESNSTLSHLSLRGTYVYVQDNIARWLTMCFTGNGFNDRAAVPISEIIRVSRLTHTVDIT